MHGTGLPSVYVTPLFNRLAQIDPPLEGGGGDGEGGGGDGEGGGGDGEGGGGDGDGGEGEGEGGGGGGGKCVCGKCE